MKEPNHGCKIVFDTPFCGSRCETCGRQWEPMTPQGSANHCLRELGSRLIAMEAELSAALSRLAAMEADARLSETEALGLMDAIDMASVAVNGLLLRGDDHKKALRMRNTLRNLYGRFSALSKEPLLAPPKGADSHE